MKFLRRAGIFAVTVVGLISLLVWAFCRFSEPNRFARTIALRFPTFPREVYPDAPPAWTNWTDVARDPAALRTFAARELASVRGPNRAACRQEATDYMNELLRTNPRTLSSRWIPNDLPVRERAELIAETVRQAHARGDFISDALPGNLRGCAPRLRNALAVQFVEHGWRDWFAALLRRQ